MLRPGRRPTTGHRHEGARPGRHLRRTGRRAAAVVVATAAVVAAAFAAAPPWLAAAAVAAGVLLLCLVALRVIAAREADAAEDRWLRGVLGSLGDRPIEGEDEDLLVP